MNCIECGSEHWIEEMTNVPFRALPSVTLVIPVRRCAECGDEEVVIPNQEALFRLLAHLLIRKGDRLAGAEVRFLRKYLGYSGERFAQVLGKRPETVSRWENDKEPIGFSSDRILRLLVAKGDAMTEYGADDLASLPGETRKSRDPIPEPQPTRLEYRDDWYQAA